MKQSFIIGIILLVGIVAIAGCTTDEPVEEDLTRIEVIEYNRLTNDNPLYWEGIWATITTEEGPYYVDDSVGLQVQENRDEPFLTKIETREELGPVRNARVIVEVYDLEGNPL